MNSDEYAVTLVETLYDFQRSGILCDVYIHLQDGQMAAHSAVLAAASPKLKELIASGECQNGEQPIRKVLELQGYNCNDAALLIQFMYTGKTGLPCSSKQYAEVLSLFDTLQVPKPGWTIHSITDRANESEGAGLVNSSAIQQLSKNTGTEDQILMEELPESHEIMDMVSENKYCLAHVEDIQQQSELALIPGLELGSKESIWVKNEAIEDFTEDVTTDDHIVTQQTPIAYASKLAPIYNFPEVISTDKKNEKNTNAKQIKSIRSIRLKQLPLSKMSIKSSNGSVVAARFLCSLCGKVCTSTDELEIHSRSHSDEGSSEVDTVSSNGFIATPRFVCSSCETVCTTTKELEEHSKCHSKAIIYACKDCGRQFSESKQLLTHSIVHMKKEGSHMCVTCGYAFGTHSRLFRHIRTSLHPVARLSSAGAVICGICNKEFADPSELYEHIKDYGGGSLNPNPTVTNVVIECLDPPVRMATASETPSRSHSCLVCGDFFYEYGSLYEHTLIHPLQTFNEVGALGCGLCGRAFDNASLLEKHVKEEASKNHKRVIRLPSASHIKQKRIFQQLPKKIKKAVRIKLTAKTQRFECNVCGRTLYNEIGFQLHLRSHTEKSLRCPECGHLFRYGKHLSKHAKMCHDIDICAICGNVECQCLDQKLDASKKNLECMECGKMFGRTRSLQEHMLVHRGEKPYVCEICGKSYRQLGSFRVHQVVHTQAFECNVCQKPFDTQKHLEAHMKIHSVECPLTCEFCGEGFIFQRSLRQHMIKHRGVNHQCQVCNREFCSRAYMLAHMKIHSGERSKCHPCEKCGKSFYNKNQLDKHMVIHDETRYRKYACDLCGKSFHYKSNLVTHARFHLNDRPHQCRFCNKSFKLKSHCIRHLKVHRKQGLVAFPNEELEYEVIEDGIIMD